MAEDDANARNTDAGEAGGRLSELTRVSARIGVLSFGGPAGQIALMHREFVEQRGWLSERQFLSALNFCMLLPGPEAMQLATYVGWRRCGVVGGLISGLLFVVPGAIVILALASVYAAFGNVPLVEAVFVGIKAAVLAIVLDALLKVARRALKVGSDWAVAAAAFVAIFALDVPFPLIILAAGVFGFWRAGVGVDEGSGADPDPDAVAAHVAPSGAAVSSALVTTVVWLGVWLVPLAALHLLLGGDHVLAQVGWFFAKMAVVTFGGAYAVLAYVAQQAVESYGWLKPGEMLDGLGLAETTPGPLILVTQFVGFIAGFRDAGWGMAVAASLVTLWATFAPCFLWIFVGAPFVERLNAMPRLKGALSAVTAAVVGVILNLSVWFALNVLFGGGRPVTFGPIRLLVPDFAAADGVAIALAVLAAVLLVGFKRGVLTTLAICAVAAPAAIYAGSALWNSVG
jgi:chromate transporter